MVRGVTRKGLNLGIFGDNIWSVNGSGSGIRASLIVVAISVFSKTFRTSKKYYKLPNLNLFLTRYISNIQFKTFSL